MKTTFLKIIAIAFLFFFPDFISAAKPSPDCNLKGVRLYGKVQVVTIGENLRVKRVSLGEDFRVRFVQNFPGSCGQWQVVENFGDFKIKYVDVGEDLKVKIVSIGEGL